MGSANAHVFSKPIFSDFADIHVLNSNTGMADTDIQFGNSNIATTQPTTQDNLKQFLLGWSYNR